MEARTPSSIISLDPHNNPLEIHGGNLYWDFIGQIIRLVLLLNPGSSAEYM